MYPECSVTEKEKGKNRQKSEKRIVSFLDHSGQTQIMDDGFRRRTAVWGWSSHRLSIQSQRKDKEGKYGKREKRVRDKKRE